MEVTGRSSSSVSSVIEEGMSDPDININQHQVLSNELSPLTKEYEMQDSHSEQNGERSEFLIHQSTEVPSSTSSSRYSPTIALVSDPACDDDLLPLSSVPTAVTDVIIPSTSSIFGDAAPGSSAGQMAQHSQEDENVLKYFIILRPTGPAATVLAKVCKSLYCGMQQNVKDYCFTYLGLSNNQYRKVFTAQERTALEAGINWEVFDITFLYKLLQRVCGLAPPSDKRWAEPDPQYADELEHCLYLIKGERNFLAHEAVTLSDLELQDRTHHMKTLLEKVLLKTGMKKDIDYSQDVTDMKSKINGILQSLPKISLDVYQNELAELRTSIVNRVVTSSQNELYPYYLKLWSCSLTGLSFANSTGRNRDGEVLEIEQFFTNITIKDANDTDVTITDLFSYCTSDGLLPQLLIVEGIAGIGKSHLCKYILHKWASKEGNDISLNGIDIIIFIQCYAVNSCSLREFLEEELLQKTCRTLRHEDVIPAIRMCHLMFIVDGIDEASSKAKGIVKEVSTKFPDSRILITCRPEYTEEAKLLTEKNKNFCTFYAKGFDKNQRCIYLNKLLNAITYNANNECETPNQLHDKIQELEDHLYYLLHLPLTIMMLVFLWLNDSNSLSHTTTATCIHQLTTDMKIKQLALRIQRKSGEVRHISLIERMCKKWLNALSKVAWKTLMENTQILDENYTSELMEEAETRDIDPVDALSTFLKCTTFEKMSGTEYNWEFFHKTFQEYLSSLFISCNPKEYMGEIDKNFSIIDQSISKQTEVNKGKLSSDASNNLDSDLHVGTRQVMKKCAVKQSKANCDCLFIFCHCFQRCFSCTNYVKDTHQYYNYPDRISEEKYYDIIERRSVGRRRKRIGSDMIRVYGVDPSPYSDQLNITGNVAKGSSGEKLAPNRKKDISFYKRTQELSKLQNTLQFLAAMEASKEDLDYEYMESIMKKFKICIAAKPWVPWVTFLRECSEHPSVCKLLSHFLDRIDIHYCTLMPGINENLEAIRYLLEKTEFKPKGMDLWFNESLTEVLSSVLFLMMKVSPLTQTEIKCQIHDSLNLKQCFNKLSHLDCIHINLNGRLKKEDIDDFVGLLNYLDEREAKLSLEIVIESTEELVDFALCCTSASLPKNVKLKIFLFHFSKAMLMPLCQVMTAYSWLNSFVFAFTHTDLGDQFLSIQNTLMDALVESSIQLKDVELTVQAHANSSLKNYREMAQAIAKGAPVDITFEYSADGDDVILTLYGARDQ